MSETYNPFSSGETKEIDAPWWSKDLKVVIRKTTYGEHVRIQGEFLNLDMQPGSTDVKADFDMEVLQIRTSATCIVSWTFKDPAGNTVPFSVDALNRLNPRDGEFIYQEIDKFNKDYTVHAREVEAAFDLVEELEAKAGSGDDAENDLTSAALALAKKNYEDLNSRLEAQGDTFP